MSSRRRELYELVIQHLKTVAREVTGREVRPVRATADFEIGLLEALAG